MLNAARVPIRTNGIATLLVAACLGFGCAKPAAIKNASSAQLQGLLEARQMAATHQSLADDVFSAAAQVERDAAVVRGAVKVVDQLAPAGMHSRAENESSPQDRCTPPIADPSAATDCVARELFRIRGEQETGEGPLTQPLHENTRVYSRAAVTLLDLLYRSQALIHEYIMTDIGPSADQIQGIRSGLQDLLQQGNQETNNEKPD